MNETKCGRAYNDKPKSETYIEFRPEKGGDESQLPQGNMNMVNGGERESAEEALGSIRRGRGGGGLFSFGGRGVWKSKKRNPEVIACLRFGYGLINLVRLIGVSRHGGDVYSCWEDTV